MAMAEAMTLTCSPTQVRSRRTGITQDGARPHARKCRWSGRRPLAEARWPGRQYSQLTEIVVRLERVVVRVKGVGPFVPDRLGGPAVTKAKANPRPRIHDLRHT